MFQSGAKKGMTWLFVFDLVRAVASLLTVRLRRQSTGKFGDLTIKGALYMRSKSKAAASHAMHSNVFCRCRRERMQQRRKVRLLSLPEKVERSLDLLDLI